MNTEELFPTKAATKAANAALARLPTHPVPKIHSPGKPTVRAAGNWRCLAPQLGWRRPGFFGGNRYSALTFAGASETFLPAQML